MNQVEVAKLLTIASVVDNRIVAKETVEGWHQIIGHLDYPVAVEAMNLHRQESDKYLMPAHIVAGVKRIRDNERAIPAVDAGVVSYPVPANLEAWSAAHDSPVEFARQEAIYHQQCRDEGFDPHAQADWRSSRFSCHSCEEQ